MREAFLMTLPKYVSCCLISELDFSHSGSCEGGYARRQSTKTGDGSKPYRPGLWS